MNQVFFTGYLPAEADERFTPDGRRKLMFDVKLVDSRGLESVQKCVIDDAVLAAEYQSLLTPGRAVVGVGELISREFRERQHNSLKGFVREIRIQRMEFPNRSGAHTGAELTEKQQRDIANAEWNEAVVADQAEQEKGR